MASRSRSGLQNSQETPSVRAGVLNVPGGPFIEIFRLSPLLRPSIGVALAVRVPSLINVGGITFNENMPLRGEAFSLKPRQSSPHC